MSNSDKTGIYEPGDPVAYRCQCALNPHLGEILLRFEDRGNNLRRQNVEHEKAIMQLAAVGVAALDGSGDQSIDKSNQYWSPAYGDVLNLRRECDRLKKALEFIAFDVRCYSLDVATGAAREALKP